MVYSVVFRGAVLCLICVAFVAGDTENRIDCHNGLTYCNAPTTCCDIACCAQGLHCSGGRCSDSSDPDSNGLYVVVTILFVVVVLIFAVIRFCCRIRADQRARHIVLLRNEAIDNIITEVVQQKRQELQQTHAAAADNNRWPYRGDVSGISSPSRNDASDGTNGTGDIGTARKFDQPENWETFVASQ